MYDIDKELVLRAAAYFATFMAEGHPPVPDRFTAKLIEQALRAKLQNGANGASVAIPPAPAPKPPKAPKSDSADMAAARATLEGIRGKGQRVTDARVRLLVCLRAAPDTEFKAKELARAAGIKDPSHSGNFHSAVSHLIEHALAAKSPDKKYKLGSKGRVE